MKNKKAGYRLEEWKVKKWEGTKRQKIVKEQRLVYRDENGHFVKEKPKIDNVSIRYYGSGVYRVGRNQKGKIIIRQKIGDNEFYNSEWWKAKHEKMKNREIFRSSYVLNNVPISVSSKYFKYAVKTGKESWTIGFRINVFSHNKGLLASLKDKLKAKLIKFIEQEIKYSKEEWWFDSYFGYESPTLVNGAKNDNGKYYLTLENQRGTIIKQEFGSLYEL